ncbi:protease-like activity factor CPAF [Candidatus Chlamydia corallus]|uniref:protease-like activity factor CPAF n=1 Tax=Candidatus Chlamydia corallus TaxID=2038470 RepID=UPI000C2FDCB7|nr:protease-like activity factor CPAF [Candidatus Chlamydia corallus]
MKKGKLGAIVFGLLFTSSVLGFSKDLTKENAHQDLNILSHLIKVKYAPLPWKHLLFGWDLSQQTKNAGLQLLLEEKPTTNYCQKVLSNYMRSLNDYHAGILFYRSESAYIPYVLKLSDDGHVFVVDVQTNQGDIYVGDELLEVDGMGIREVIEGLRYGRGSATDYSAAVRSLTSRSAAFGDNVPTGITMLKLRRSSGVIRSTAVRWRYTPEHIGDFSLIAPLIPDHKPQLPSQSCALFRSGLNQSVSSSSLFSSYMVPYFWEELQMQNKQRFDSKHHIGSRNGFLPSFGSIIWEQNEGPYRAYIFKAKDAQGNPYRIGFLRISSYVWSELEGTDDNHKENPWELFGEIIDVFQKESDALIIDQTNNPGGSVFYLYSLLSMLINRPLETPKHRMILTQDEVSSALHWQDLLEDVFTDEQAAAVLGETMEGYCMDMHAVASLQSFSQNVLACWAAGDINLSKPMPLLGFGQIQPHPKHRFTKPLFMLINEDDYSCGDLAPAILKDNGRATIIGKATAGAGGFVFQVNFPNRSGIKSVSLTGSLAVRPDGEYIENLGVAPHIDLGFTSKDLQTGRFSDYVETVKTIVVTSLAESAKKSEEEPQQEAPEVVRISNPTTAPTTQTRIS